MTSEPAGAHPWPTSFFGLGIGDHGADREHLEDDVPWRYEVATPLTVTNSQIEISTRPGLGIEFDPEVALAHPAERNLAPPSDSLVERTYVQPRPRRSRLYRPRD